MIYIFYLQLNAHDAKLLQRQNKADCGQPSMVITY